MAAPIQLPLHVETAGRAHPALRLCALACALLIARSAYAADLRIIEPSEHVDAREITRIFAQPVSESSAPKTRSIRRAPTQENGAPSGIALRVQFALDSAEIPPAGMRQLDVIATGIAALPDAPRIAIEGYTDSSGSDRHNEALSLRRAQAVRDYLVSRGVTSGWLTPRGLGSSAPLKHDEPRAKENRRVEFRRIS